MSITKILRRKRTAESAIPTAEPAESGELKLDPLYTIFEKHLYDFEDDAESPTEFVDKIAKDYIQFLHSRKVAVPGKWQHLILDELRDQIRRMMVKKMYGCLSMQEFIQKSGASLQEKRKTARRKYRKLY